MVLALGGIESVAGPAGTDPVVAPAVGEVYAANQ